MKIKMLAVGLVLAATPAFAQYAHEVRGYTRSDGTYVAPHMQTNPNGNAFDNWSSRPNVNPYTGREGTVDPYSAQSRQRSSYGSSDNSTGWPR
ncbi:hypothetical protein [Sphingomonas oryzagri]|uniref:Endonuclease n=1 Tax=Sphingomonas oryzagri TaxID=3042314 RepID=A0ABT6N5R4_9SPHN|nr:hypothetical protein [Sphingomonas oryzagri]MDH7640453.1 hypothetical protein [Sphingomonas oryzagri]